MAEYGFFQGLAGFCNDCSTNALDGIGGLLGGVFGNAVTNATATASASYFWQGMDRDVVYWQSNGQTHEYTGQQLMQWAVAGQQQMPAALQRHFEGLVERAHEQEWQRQMAARAMVAQQQTANDQAPQQGDTARQWAVPSEDAQKKARELLDRHLTPEQRERLATFGHFEVVGQSGKVYRIKRGQVANVFEVDVKDGQRRNVVQLCAQPQAVRVPDEDAMLAQKLYLECDEKAFLKIANKQRLAA